MIHHFKTFENAMEMLMLTIITVDQVVNINLADTRLTLYIFKAPTIVDLHPGA